MTYLSNIAEETDIFEDRKVFHANWSERNWRHLMKLYRYMNRARGIKSYQHPDSRSCFVPSARKRKRTTSAASA